MLSIEQKEAARKAAAPYELVEYVSQLCEELARIGMGQQALDLQAIYDGLRYMSRLTHRSDCCGEYCSGTHLVEFR